MYKLYTHMLNSNCYICGLKINIARDSIVLDGVNIMHSRCLGNNFNMHVVYCSNCDSPPVILEEIEDREITRCNNCGVLMHDGIEVNN